MVNYILKIFKSISVECMERLNEDAKKKVTNCTRMFATLTVGNISFISRLLMIEIAFLNNYRIRNLWTFILGTIRLAGIMIGDAILELFWNCLGIIENK